MALIRKQKPTPTDVSTPGPKVKIYIAPDPKDHAVVVQGTGRIEHLQRVMICCDTSEDPVVYIEFTDTEIQPGAVSFMTKTLHFPLFQTEFCGLLEIDYPQQQ